MTADFPEIGNDEASRVGLFCSPFSVNSVPPAMSTEQLKITVIFASAPIMLLLPNINALCQYDLSTGLIQETYSFPKNNENKIAE